MSCEYAIDQASAGVRLAELKRPPWDVLSSVELAELLGISIQVLANWRIRCKGPSPVPKGVFRGNRTYYRIFEVERWLRSKEGEGTENWCIVAEWLRSRYHFPEPLETEDRTWRVAEQLRGWSIWPLKHRPRRRVPLRANSAITSSVK